MWRVVRRLLSVPLIALALLGCGDSTEDEYRDGFGTVNRQLVALGDLVGAGLRNAGESDDAELTREFRGYAGRLAQLRGQLDELDAPESIEREHERLLTATAAVRASLGAIAEAAQHGDAAAARAATIELVRGSERLSQARRKLARAVRDL